MKRRPEFLKKCDDRIPTKKHFPLFGKVVRKPTVIPKGFPEICVFLKGLWVRATENVNLLGAPMGGNGKDDLCDVW